MGQPWSQEIYWPQELHQPFQVLLAQAARSGSGTETHIVFCRYLLGPVAGPDQRACHHFQKASLQSPLAITLKVCRRNVALELDMVAGRLKILPQGGQYRH